MSNREKELIDNGIIPADNVCVCCGERYAVDGQLCHRCKTGEYILPKKKQKFITKLKFKIKEFLK